MIIRQLIYAFSLVASFIFYMLYPPWISWYLFILALLLIPLDLIISVPGMMSKGLLIRAPSVVEKDSTAFLTLTTTHSKSYPVRFIIAKLLVTGDDFSAVCKVKCPAEKDGRREVSIDTSRSGVTVIEIKRIWTVSLIGIFALPCNVKIKEAILVLPQPVKPENTMALQHGFHLKPKPGGGFSEEHDMREYRKGDPVRSIHWKISAKFNSLYIREPLALPPHSRLVHMMKWNGAAERDIILGRIRWVSDYMLKWHMPFYLKYGDEITLTEVKQDSDLHDFLRNALAKNMMKVNINIIPPSRFSWVFHVDARGINAENEVKAAAAKQEVSK